MPSLVLIVLPLFSAVLTLGQQGSSEWRTGRASFYGTDAWPIHIGSCGFGQIDKDKDPLGWDVVAVPDVSPDYAGSCGTCVELMCDPSNFKDGYGQSLDRTSACYDSSKSVIARVVDTCPCVYPDNAFSNKRWCCGDMPHLDISAWAFEKLADKKWGVIGLKYRRVPCTYKPGNPAPPIASPSAGVGIQRVNQPVVRDWPEFWPGRNSPDVIFEDGYRRSNWNDQSYNAARGAGSCASGLTGKSSLCALLSEKGAVSLATSGSPFANRIAIHLWMYVGTSTTVSEGYVVNIGGPAGACRPVDLSDVKPLQFKPSCSGCTDYWWLFELYLTGFAGFGNKPINNAVFFKGCGGQAPSGLNYLEIQNHKQGSMQMALDGIHLV